MRKVHIALLLRMGPDGGRAAVTGFASVLSESREGIHGQSNELGRGKQV